MTMEPKPTYIGADPTRRNAARAGSGVYSVVRFRKYPATEICDPQSRGFGIKEGDLVARSQLELTVILLLDNFTNSAYAEFSVELAF